MKFATFAFGIAFAILSLLTIALGAAVTAIREDNAVSLPYPLAIPTFKGTVNGQAYEINGTLQEVEAQLAALHPGVNLNSDGPEDEAHTLAAREILASRSKDALLCFNRQDWPAAPWGRAYDGAQRITSRPGTISIPGRSCVYLYCDETNWRYQSAVLIAACNDNKYQIDPNTSYLGTYADDIVNKCYRLNILLGWRTQGQYFDTDNYNVFIHTENRC